MTVLSILLLFFSNSILFLDADDYGSESHFTFVKVEHKTTSNDQESRVHRGRATPRELGFTILPSSSGFPQLNPPSGLSWVIEEPTEDLEACSPLSCITLMVNGEPTLVPIPENGLSIVGYGEFGESWGCNLREVSQDIPSCIQKP